MKRMTIQTQEIKLKGWNEKFRNGSRASVGFSKDSNEDIRCFEKLFRAKC